MNNRPGAPPGGGRLRPPAPRGAPGLSPRGGRPADKHSPGPRGGAGGGGAVVGGRAPPAAAPPPPPGAGGGRGAGAVRDGPFDGVRDDPADVLVVVHRVVLVPGAEEEDLAVASAERATGAENLAPCEGADEDQFLRRGDVKEFSVHFLLVDDDRV